MEPIGVDYGNFCVNMTGLERRYTITLSPGEYQWYWYRARQSGIISLVVHWVKMFCVDNLVKPEWDLCVDDGHFCVSRTRLGRRYTATQTRWISVILIRGEVIWSLFCIVVGWKCVDNVVKPERVPRWWPLLLVWLNYSVHVNVMDHGTLTGI